MSSQRSPRARKFKRLASRCDCTHAYCSDEGTVARARCQKRMAADTSPPNSLHIPVLQEAVELGRRVVDTGRGVRLHKTVTEEVLKIDEALQRQELQVERVVVNVWIDGTPPVQRQEGDTLVIPVLEEVLVVQKRLRLTEEIRITAKTREHTATQQVVLREEHVAIERFDETGASRGVPEAPP